MDLGLVALKRSEGGTGVVAIRLAAVTRVSDGVGIAGFLPGMQGEINERLWGGSVPSNSHWHLGHA